MNPSSRSVSPYLNEVIASLEPVEEVMQAQTAQKKQDALLKAFRKRANRAASEWPETAAVMKAPELAAENALKHIFPGQPSYPPQFRGKDELDWDSNPFKDFEWI